MKAVLCVAAFLAGFTALPTPARAELPVEDESLTRSRFYIGFGPVIGIENFHILDQNNVNLGSGPTLSGVNPDVEDRSYGGEVRMGYRFHPNLAAELQGQYNGQWNVKGNTHGALGRPDLGTVRAVTGSANLKVYPFSGILTDWVQPYALGGVGALWIDTQNKVQGGNLPLDDVSFAGRGGIGVDAYLTPMVGLYAEGAYVAPVGPLSRYGLAAMTVGMQMHF